MSLTDKKGLSRKKDYSSLNDTSSYMLSTVKINQLSVSSITFNITFNRLWARIAGHSFNYLFLISLLTYQSSARKIKCWSWSWSCRKTVARNINIHLYSIKLLRNNSLTFLHFYKPLNYESSLMRNDYILKIILAIIFTSQPSQQKKKLNE